LTAHLPHQRVNLPTLALHHLPGPTIQVAPWVAVADQWEAEAAVLWAVAVVVAQWAVEEEVRKMLPVLVGEVGLFHLLNSI
jgi:hypothetical protein